MSHSPFQGGTSLVSLLLSSFLVWGTVLLGEVGFQRQGASVRAASRPVTDTIDPSPIEAKSCAVYDWFYAAENGWESEGYGPLPGTHYASLHELTCKWAAYQHGLSLDSTRLPKYVRPIGDSLRIGKEVLAYSVEMVQLEEHPSNVQHTLYFVAELSDSLYYKEITDTAPHDPSYPDTVAVRSLRPLDVPQAEVQYLWFEYAKFGTSTQNGGSTWERWYARVLTYDRRRGMRHLTGVPIRYEKTKNGEFYGVRQLDVRIPKAGIMEVEERLQRGANLTKGMGWHRVTGTHVIDPTATSKREVEAEAGYPIIIDTTEVENWREKYEQY